jgi:hypothetical protein
MRTEILYRELHPDQVTRFVERGYRPRQFFPHRIYAIPKCGPDAMKLTRSMAGRLDRPQYWTLLVHSTSPVTDRFPPGLFFDDDLVWHRQHYGLPGHVAFGLLTVTGTRMYGLNFVSDPVQRQSRRPDYRTQIQRRFNGWIHMLLNGMLDFAISRGVEEVYSPTAALALRNTDRARHVGRDLFQRIYDRAVTEHFEVERRGAWWVIPVDRNRDRVVVPERKVETRSTPKTICITHDVERGLGHAGADPSFARRMNESAPELLDAILIAERLAGCKATYHVVGLLFDELRPRIESDHHCLAFHTFDHECAVPFFLLRHVRWNVMKAVARIRSALDTRLREPVARQLRMCRKIDYRVRGYRPAQSVITPELTEENLCYYGFDWLASSERSVGTARPVLADHLVRIPVHFDDFPLYRGELTWDRWRERALEQIARNDFVAFGLHDCYAELWLPFYDEFLDRVTSLGTVKTLDEVTNDVVLGSCA